MHNSRINTAGSRNKNALALYTHRRQIGQHHAKLEDKNLQRGLQDTAHNGAANRVQAAAIENHHYLNDTSSHPFLSEHERHAQANYHPPAMAALQPQRDDYPRPQTLPQTYLSLAMYFANLLPSAFPELAGMRFAKHLPHAVLVEKNQSATQNNTAPTTSNLEPTILKPSDHAPSTIREPYHGGSQTMVWHREDSEEAIRRAVRSAHSAASTPLSSGRRSTTNSYVPAATTFPHSEITSAHPRTIATISTMASSSTISPSAVSATTATAVMSSPTWLARETVRDTFIQYVQLLVPTIDQQASLSDVFKAYLQYDQRYRSHHQEMTPTADNHPFMTDWELQRYVRDQFGWVTVDSPQMRSDIAHHLALSLVDVVNIKGAYIDAHHRIHQITYNGFSFRGFPSDIPILHAKHRIIETLSGAAQRNLDIDNTQAKHFGLLLLSAIAPELCKLKDNDFAASKMIYGDRQHALLHIGLDVANQFDFSSQQYNTTQLKQIATAVMKEVTIPLLEDGRISVSQAGKGLPWSDAALLFMANAQGAIDLSEMHKKNTTTLTQELERFVQSEFKNERQVRDALAALKDAEIPTRKKIAQSELTQRGINPHRQIEVESTVTGLSTGAVVVSRSSRRYNTTLVELWLNKHVETLPLVRQDIVHVEDRNALDALPSLTALFDQSFNTYRNDIAQHIGELLAAALNMQTSKQQRKDAFFSLWTVADHPGFGFSEKTMEDKFFIEMWHGRDYAQKKREVFFYVEGSQADCLTLKPLNQTLIDWMDNALHQLKTGQRRPQEPSPIEYIMRGSESLEEFFNTLGYKFATILRAIEAAFKGRLTATGGPAILRHEYVTSKDINVVTRSAGDIFVERHIDPLKQHAYGITPTEKMIEGTREFLLPLYGPVKSFLNWQTLSQAERLGSIFGGLLESMAFIPGFYQLGKLGLSTTTLLAKTAQRGIGMAQRFGPRIGAKVSLATLKAGTPQLAKHSTKLAIEVVDMFFPIGSLPRGGGKLRRADAVDLTHIAQDMTGSHPELAAHFNQLAHARVTKENHQWVVTDPARIYYRHGPHYTVDGRDYRVASLGRQEHVLLKKHLTEEGFYFTAVNPLQDQAYGPRLHLSEHGKPYLDRQATAARLHGYAASVQNRNIKTDTALVSLTHAQHSYASLDGRQRYIQMGDATVLTGQPPHAYYLLEKTDEGHFYIVHPATSTSHQTDSMAISPDRAKIGVEVIDGNWQLTLTDVPEQFAHIKGGETATWQPHGRDETFIVARLSDSDRIVALKAEGGKYREIDWATGKPRHDRSFIYKNSDGLYSHGALGGSGPKKKKAGKATPAHVETETVAAPRQQNTQQENVAAVVEPAASRRRLQDIRQENAARIAVARSTVESEIRTYQEKLKNNVHRAETMKRQMDNLEGANEEVTWLKFADRYVKHVEKMIDEGDAMLNFMKNIHVEAVPVADFKQKLSVFYAETAGNVMTSSLALRVVEGKLERILKAMLPDGSLALRTLAPQDRALFLEKLDWFITCFDKLSQAQRKFDKSLVGRISVEQLREVPFLRSIESEKLLEQAKKIEARVLSQDFFSGGMHMRLLEMKVDLELRLKMQDSPHAQDFVVMSESTSEKFIFADASFVEAVLNKRMPDEIAALRRLDLGHQTDSFDTLSDEDRLRLLFSLDEQYKEVVLENSWRAEQCAQQGWLAEENIYRKLSQFAQERQTLAAKVLDDFLLKQAPPSVSHPAAHVVAAISSPATPAQARSALIVIETEFGSLAGKTKQGHADIVEIKDGRGQTLAEYEAVPTSSQVTSTQRTWIRKQPQVADESLLDEIKALRVREDLTKVANKLNNKVEEWVKKAQQLEREKEKAIKLANWMVEHPPVDETSVLEPARIQNILALHAKELDEHVKKMTSIQKQFEHLTKKLPSVTMRDDVEAPFNHLKQLSIMLRQQGKDCRVRLIKKQPPNDAGVRYLAELKEKGDPLAASFHIEREKYRLALQGDSSYFDEYKITIDENLPKWYAHFHYKNRNDNDNKFTVAHLKQESEYNLGKNWQKLQMARGEATKIYRARVQPETAESFFFAR